MPHRFHTLNTGLRRNRGELNRTEAAFARTLDVEIAAGELVRYWVEPFSLRLSSPPTGQPARYTPDFLLLRPDGEVWIVDVKGGGPGNEAAFVRLKCAAELYPLWRFFLVRAKSSRQGGGFSWAEV